MYVIKVGATEFKVKGYWNALRMLGNKIFIYGKENVHMVSEK